MSFIMAILGVNQNITSGTFSLVTFSSTHNRGKFNKNFENRIVNFLSTGIEKFSKAYCQNLLRQQQRLGKTAQPNPAIRLLCPEFIVADQTTPLPEAVDPTPVTLCPNCVPDQAVDPTPVTLCPNCVPDQAVDPTPVSLCPNCPEGNDQLPPPPVYEDPTSDQCLDCPVDYPMPPLPEVVDPNPVPPCENCPDGNDQPPPPPEEPAP
ncbi:hypothetical protein Btru_072957 [Bulinus truncatus]|nr:hypothetical protein Btru_072957 [Bulinus truncatus]